MNIANGIRHALLATLAVLALASSAFAQDFCWRDSFGRGVGEIPGNCPAGKQKVGALCYDQCPAGMKRAGVDCHSVCPDGMRDDGLFCRKAEYGRGAGYPWKVGDKIGSLDQARNRCEKDHGDKDCEKYGEIIYPKCKAGYDNEGANICRPEQPKCDALGLGGRVDLSCGKKIQVGKIVAAGCNANQVKDGGLCYAQCKAGYGGVGPVCWGQPPSGFVDCSMGAAKDKNICAKVTTDQVVSVTVAAASVAALASTFGASEAGSAAANAAEKATMAEKLKTLLAAIQAAEASSKVLKVAVVASNLNQMQQGVTGYINASNKAETDDASYIATKVDLSRMIMQATALAASMVSPTAGAVVGAAASFTYPKCSELTGAKK